MSKKTSEDDNCTGISESIDGRTLKVENEKE